MKKLIEPDILHMLRESPASFHPDIFCIHHESLKNSFGITCVEVNILTDQELQERDERIEREAFEAVKKLCYEIPHEEADRLLPAQSIAGDWAAETAIGIYTKIDKITFEDYKKSKREK